MSTSSLIFERARGHWLARVGDYVELTKPRIGILVLATVAVSYCTARWGQPEPLVMLHTLIGTLLVAGSASALNQWLERRLDSRMERTADRPLPSGRMTGSQAIMFAAFAIAFGEAYLMWAVNLQAAMWGLATWAIYVWIYTPLKTRTAWNTAIGAVAGAMPVMIGWTAAGGAYDLRAAALFALVFFWQFPHFMAIAWMYREQYGAAGMKMLSTVDPTGQRAGLQAVGGALALLPVSLLPGLYTPGWGGPLYLVVALGLSLFQLGFAIAFWSSTSHAAARRLLRVSLIYLPVLLILITIVLWV